MRRRKLFSSIALLLPGLTWASNILETQTFVLTLPKGWVRNLDTSPVSARGPQGETLQISSSRIKGAGDPTELAQIRKEMEEIGLKTLRLAESEPGLTIEAAITRSEPSNGVVLNEVTYLAKDTGWRIAQFSVLGPRTAILVSVRIPKGNYSSLGELRKSIRAIAWAPREA